MDIEMKTPGTKINKNINFTRYMVLEDLVL